MFPVQVHIEILVDRIRAEDEKFGHGETKTAERRIQAEKLSKFHLFKLAFEGTHPARTHGENA